MTETTETATETLRRVASENLLDGLAVVEVSTTVAGGYAGRLLASMGADIVRAARPLETANSDAATPILDQWFSVGKTEVQRGSAELLGALDSAALVIVELDPGDPEFHEFAESLVRRAQELPHHPVVVVLRHAVQAGKTIPGTALTISAWSGMSWAMGHADRAPLTLPFDLAAYQGGIHACAAGLAAVVADPDPKLRNVDVASRDVVAFFTGMITANFLPYGRPWARDGARPPGSAGVYPASIFSCLDGHVVLMCRSQKEWDILLEGMGSPEWSQDPKFRDPRVVARFHADEADSHLVPWVAERTKQDLLDFGQRLGLPIAPVRSMAEAMAEPQLAYRDSLIPVAGHPEIRAPHVPWRLLGSGEPASRKTTRSWPLSREASDSPKSLFSGLRVLDLSWVWSGPMVTSVMADLGAEVLKIEHTESLDSGRLRGKARRNGVEVAGPEHEATPYFNQMNHGKKSITMNLKDPGARELALELAAHCDVVVENMRPGAMQRIGLSYDALAERNPGIVMLSMSMAGQTGPLRQMKGYAGIMAAMSGLESLIGYDEQDIVGSLAPAIGDPNAAGHAMSVLFAALYRRKLTGRGVWIDLSQNEALMCVLAGPMIDSQLPDGVRVPANSHPRQVPGGHFRCAGEDSWIALSIRSDAEWSALVDEAGPLLGNERWSSFEDRSRHRDAVEAAVAAWVATRKRDELVCSLQKRGLAVAPVNSFEDIMGSEWKADRGLSARVEHPYLGETEIFVAPWKFGGESGGVPAPAPILGSSTAEVLGKLLDVSEDDIRQLQHNKVLY